MICGRFSELEAGTLHLATAKAAAEKIVRSTFEI